MHKLTLAFSRCLGSAHFHSCVCWQLVEVSSATAARGKPTLSTWTCWEDAIRAVVPSLLPKSAWRRHRVAIEQLQGGLEKKLRSGKCYHCWLPRSCRHLRPAADERLRRGLVQKLHSSEHAIGAVAPSLLPKFASAAASRGNRPTAIDQLQHGLAPKMLSVVPSLPQLASAAGPSSIRTTSTWPR